MSKNLIICAVIFCLFIIILVLYLISRKRIAVKYGLVWIILFLLLLLATLFPKFLVWITSLLGFKTASNMVIMLIIGICVLINIVLTVIVSDQNKRIRLLIQEMSMLKSDQNEEK